MLWKKLGPLRRPVGLMLIGAVFVLSYPVLAGLGVGELGTPGDPGGGGILVVGDILVGSGLIAMVANLLRRRPGHRRGRRRSDRE